MNNYVKNKNYSSFMAKHNSGITTVFRLCRLVTLAITAVAAMTVSTGDWGLKSAMADSKPALNLTVTGPQTAETGEPLEGISVQLTNPGAAAQDSRLRLLIHEQGGRKLKAGDIKIDVQEGNAWKSVTVESIEGGVLAAIGAEGKPHKERHKRGGFAIAAKAHKEWQLRMTFRLSGSYKLVVAVSPDNGQTQLAQPVSLIEEVL